MDFDFSDEQKAFAKSIQEFAEKEIAPGARERERTAEFPHDIWSKLADFGLLGLPVPEEYGGGGADAVTTTLANEVFARYCLDFDLMVKWGSHTMICAMPIAVLGSEDQKGRYLPGLCDGSRIGAFALTEPEAGSDATALKSKAVRNGDKYILNGSKIYISNAPHADTFVTFAKTTDEAGNEGISNFIVESGFPGFVRGKPLEIYSPSVGSDVGEIAFDDCQVPAENLMGQEGQGFTAMLTSLGWERLAFAGFLGMMDHNLEECIAYAKERHAFGRPISKFQLIQAKLADMAVDLEAARLLTYKLAWMFDTGQVIHLQAAMAKLFTTEAALRNALEGIQIFGGYGCMTEESIGRALWAAKASVIGGGTSEIQRIVIARMLLR
jgi:alkylation response protein AidB-like acyl-CoA dehydrogenase